MKLENISAANAIAEKLKDLRLLMGKHPNQCYTVSNLDGESAVLSETASRGLEVVLEGESRRLIQEFKRLDKE